MEIFSSIIGGLLVLAGALLVLGRKLQTIDDLKTGYKEISQDIKLLIDRIGRLEGRWEGGAEGDFLWSLPNLEPNYYRPAIQTMMFRKLHGEFYLLSKTSHGCDL